MAFYEKPKIQNMRDRRIYLIGTVWPLSEPW